MAKPKPPEQLRPIQGMKSKRILHWTLLALTPVSAAVVLGAAYTGAFNGSSADAFPTATEEENPAMQNKAISFAVAFASEYLYVTPDHDEHRQRIAKFLADGMDENAGLSIEDAKKSMYPGEIRFWESKPIGANQAEITLQVDLYYAQDGKAKERRIRYLKVPIEVKGPDQMAVIGTPHFVPLRVHKSNLSKKIEDLEGSEVDGSTTNEIRKFLEDFFQDYASGKDTDLAYKSAEKPIQGFRGELQFLKLESAEVAKNGNTYEALVTVKMADTKASAVLEYDYRISVIQDGSHWKVLSLKPAN